MKANVPVAVTVLPSTTHFRSLRAPRRIGGAVPEPRPELAGPRLVDRRGREVHVRLGHDLAAADRLARRRAPRQALRGAGDRKSTRLNSSHVVQSYAVFCFIHT